MGFSMGNLIAKKAKEDKRSAATAAGSRQAQPRNVYLSRPVKPEDALKIFLGQIRNASKGHLPKGKTFPVTEVCIHRDILCKNCSFVGLVYEIWVHANKFEVLYIQTSGCYMLLNLILSAAILRS